MSADQFLFEETVDPQESQPVATDKRLYYIQDQNGGAYNGQIQFDTSTLANSGQWLAYSEAVLEIPFTITYQGSENITDPGVSSFGAALKNGYYQIIDSIQIDYNNTNVVQQQPFTNFFVQYKLMSSMGPSDLKKWGSILNFAPDSSGSASYSEAKSVNGDGVSNNIITNNTANNAYAYDGKFPFDQVNTGLRQRCQNTGYPATSTVNGYGSLGTFLGPGDLPASSGIAAGRCAQIGKNYCSDNGVAAAGRIWSWNIVATIRLKDVADFFDKLPLVRGAFMRITINYNSCVSTVSTTTADGATVSVSASHVQRSGRTNPVMLTSSGLNQPNKGLPTHVGTVITYVGNNNPLLSAARLYVNAYTLNTVYTRDILTVKPNREVKYLDIYNYVVPSIASGGQINAILTNGIVNPKYVVIIPQLTGLAANTGLAIAMNPYQSLFDSSPGTTCPLALLGQFNIQVAGANMYQSNLRYDYEVFYNEVSSINALNGGLSTGMTSGLISSYDWDNLYRYYVCDLSRRVPSEDGVAKSVVFQGVNLSAKTMDYICFIAFERKVVIEMDTGMLLPS